MLFASSNRCYWTWEVPWFYLHVALVTLSVSSNSHICKLSTYIDHKSKLHIRQGLWNYCNVWNRLQSHKHLRLPVLRAIVSRAMIPQLPNLLSSNNTQLYISISPIPYSKDLQICPNQGPHSLRNLTHHFTLGPPREWHSFQPTSSVLQDIHQHLDWKFYEPHSYFNGIDGILLEANVQVEVQGGRAILVRKRKVVYHRTLPTPSLEVLDLRILTTPA